jgi:hypothetical protein
MPTAASVAVTGYHHHPHHKCHASSAEQGRIRIDRKKFPGLNECSPIYTDDHAPNLGIYTFEVLEC